MYASLIILVMIVSELLSWLLLLYFFGYFERGARRVDMGDAGFKDETLK